MFGSPVAIPIPVAWDSQPPDGEDALLFDSFPANEWTEQFRPIDLPVARKLGSSIARDLIRWGELLRPVTP